MCSFLTLKRLYTTTTNMLRLCTEHFPRAIFSEDISNSGQYFLPIADIMTHKLASMKSGRLLFRQFMFIFNGRNSNQQYSTWKLQITNGRPTH